MQEVVDPMYIYVGIIFVTAGAILVVIKNVLDIIAHSKRKPSIDVTLEKFLKKEEYLRYLDAHKDTHSEIKTDIGEIKRTQKEDIKDLYEEIKKNQYSINKALQDINKSIGHLSGEIKKKE